MYSCRPASAGFLPRRLERSHPVHPNTSNEIPLFCQKASIYPFRVQREHFPWGCDATHKSPSIQPSQLQAPNHKYHSLLFYLVAAGPKIHKQSSLCCFTPLVWLLTSNLSENRNLSCVSVRLEKIHNISVLFHLGYRHYFKRKYHRCCSCYWHQGVPQDFGVFPGGGGRAICNAKFCCIKTFTRIFFCEVHYQNTWRSIVIFRVLLSCRTLQIRMTECISELFTSNTGGILVSFQ